ncbi:MAG: PAS domain S-box protein [Burkholderiaceae bacterium]|nr:PAS domain S-box protein [Rhodoferax sp.]MCP5284744.1 PAS domain S-box protein [Burkholderiaceae bacterium]
MSTRPPPEAAPPGGSAADALSRLRRRQRQLLVVLGVLGALVVAVTGLHLSQQRAAVQDGAQALLELEARALEGQVSRVADATANALIAISAWPSLAPPMPKSQVVNEALRAQLPGLPFVRSLSMVDRTGHVLASSTARNVGVTVPPAFLASIAGHTSGMPMFGARVAARDLADAAQPDAPVAPGFAGSMTMSLRIDHADGPRWLVAMIAVDYLTNMHALMAGNLPGSAAVLSFEGDLISHTGTLNAGTRLAKLPPFTEFLPAREHGTYQGTGSEGAAVSAAFRTVRRWPLVVLAERPQSSIDAELRDRAAIDLASVVVVVGLLAGFGWVAQRSLRQDARVTAEREALHKQVALAEERWKRALDGAGQYVWELDLGRSVFTASAGLNRFLGYGDAESRWDFAVWQSRVHPDDLTAATERFRQHLGRETPAYEVEQRMLTAAGGWVWVRVRGMVSRWDDTGTRAMTASGTLADINLRKASEQALRASEARQQAILASALDGIITVDETGLVLDFNPASERIFGVARSDIVGRPMHDFIVPHHMRERHLEGMSHYRRTGEGPVLNRRIEVEGLRSNGELFPLELAVVPVKTEAGELFTATVRDISESRRVQQALGASEERFRSVFEQAGVGMVQSHPSGGTIHANEAICRMLGYSADHDLPDLHTLLHDEDGDADPRNHGHMLQRGADSVSSECRFRHRDGHWVSTRVTASLMRFTDDRPPIMLSIIEDISDRKRAEQELARARQREIDAGARIQRTLLDSQVDERMRGWWLGTLSAASQGIDGDFVEVVELGGGVVDILVGDVMGKGTNAALLGAATKMRFSRCVTELLAKRPADAALPRPAHIVAALHDAMTPSLQALESFVAISYMRLDGAQGTVTWVGCGSEEPLLVGADSVRTLGNQHPPLGVLTRLNVEEGQTSLKPGDAVFLASDGAADALLPDGTRVGRDRVNALIADLLQASPAPSTVLHALRRTLAARGAQVVDDLSMVLAVASGDPIAASRRLLAQGMADIVHVRGLVEHRALRLGLDETQTSLFVTACVEAYTNVLRHMPGRPVEAPVELLVRTGTRALTVEFVSVGDHFEAPVALADTDFGAFPEGGFGLTIMAQAADQVEYLHASGINTVRLTHLVPSSGR